MQPQTHAFTHTHTHERPHIPTHARADIETHGHTRTHHRVIGRRWADVNDSLACESLASADVGQTLASISTVIHIDAPTHARMHARTYASTYVHTYVRTLSYMHAQFCKQWHVFTLIRIYIRMHACMRARTNALTHARTRTPPKHGKEREK